MNSDGFIHGFDLRGIDVMDEMDGMFVIQWEKKTSNRYRMTIHNADKTLRRVGPVGRMQVLNQRISYQTGETLIYDGK